jgi:hypothetical protein
LEREKQRKQLGMCLDFTYQVMQAIAQVLSANNTFANLNEWGVNLIHQMQGFSISRVQGPLEVCYYPAFQFAVARFASEVVLYFVNEFGT